MDQHVRPPPAGLGGEAAFANEVAPLAQAGAFQHVFQDEFAPVALGLLLAAQGGGQVMGLLGDLAVELLEVEQLLAEGRLLLHILVVDVLDLGAKTLDLLAEGP